jgi:hypothetical protein
MVSWSSLRDQSQQRERIGGRASYESELFSMFVRSEEILQVWGRTPEAPTEAVEGEIVRCQQHSSGGVTV